MILSGYRLTLINLEGSEESRPPSSTALYHSSFSKPGGNASPSTHLRHLRSEQPGLSCCHTNADSTLGNLFTSSGASSLPQAPQNTSEEGRPPSVVSARGVHRSERLLSNAGLGQGIRYYPGWPVHPEEEPATLLVAQLTNSARSLAMLAESRPPDLR